MKRPKVSRRDTHVFFIELKILPGDDCVPVAGVADA